MNTFRFALLKSVALLGFTTTALALTVTQEVNPAYVQKHVATSGFELGESFFAENGDSPVPLPGTVNYRFKLSEFIPAGLLEAARGK